MGDLVQQLREMASGADVETAEYMVQDIFEEYPFFAQYPVDKLRTTAALIGTMVAQGVLIGRSLFVALKMILECLQVRFVIVSCRFLMILVCLCRPIQCDGGKSQSWLHHLCSNMSDGCQLSILCLACCVAIRFGFVSFEASHWLIFLVHSLAVFFIASCGDVLEAVMSSASSLQEWTLNAALVLLLSA